MHSSQNQHTYNRAGPPRIVGHIQVPSNGFSARRVQGAPLTRTPMTNPPIEPSYESQRLAHTPKPHGHYGLTEQGSGYNGYTEPALQRPMPLVNSQYLPQQAASNLYNGSHAPYQPLRSGMSAYMPQQGLAESSTQRWFEIPNGGVDLHQPFLTMGNVISNRDITVRFPDGTLKVVDAQGDLVTLEMAANTVREWYMQYGRHRWGSMLKGFRLDGGIYVAHIV